MSTFDHWDDSTERFLHLWPHGEHTNPAGGASTAAPAPLKKATGKRTWLIVAGVIIVLLAVAGAIVGALVGTHVIKTSSKPESSASSASSQDGSNANSGLPQSGPSNNSSRSNRCSTASEIPSNAKNTWLDPTSWLIQAGFNCTFTDETVGGLPVVGLNSTWDDSARANPNVPPLNQPWGSYSKTPFRGVNLGGWLSLEPFITPSLFDTNPKFVDEYTLSQGLDQAASKTLEQHYATFITERDFKEIADAGLDHVRIPYSYWAVKTFPGDPFVAQVSWRYLLRGIEWARKYGLRVKLDLHAAPGSQNGWNHSGRVGQVDWLVGPDGALNAQRTLDMHNQLSKFFAQNRYQNVVVMYGLLNEPSAAVGQDELIAWTSKAIKTVQDNGLRGIQLFSEAMRGLPGWAGKLQGYGDSVAVDVHMYTIFDLNLSILKHADRIKFVCNVYSDQISASIKSGFGPTIVGEWSQAETDCTKYLNGVGAGARWTGTFNGEPNPSCPTGDSQCSCDMANVPIANMTSDYKLFLKTYAQAQMIAFEKSWGWFYWTWKTETAPTWSYQAALAGGLLPSQAYKHDWDCSKPIPSFGNLPEYY